MCSQDIKGRVLKTQIGFYSILECRATRNNNSSAWHSADRRTFTVNAVKFGREARYQLLKRSNFSFFIERTILMDRHLRKIDKEVKKGLFFMKDPFRRWNVSN